jgi:hypothetical protein
MSAAILRKRLITGIIDKESSFQRKSHEEGCPNECRRYD